MAVDTDDIVRIVASTGFMIMAGAAIEFNRRKRKKRSRWVKSWILARPVRGAYNALFIE